jgi:hypothetical protein
MFVNCLHDDPRKTLPKARLLLPFGLLVLSLGTAWPHVIAPHLHPAQGMNDLIQGFCVGLGITLEIGSVVLVRKLGNRLRTN